MATHLAASLKIVQRHQNRPRATIADAAKAVKEAAHLAGTGGDAPENAVLVAKLERACGCTIAELAAIAEGWPGA